MGIFDLFRRPPKSGSASHLIGPRAAGIETFNINDPRFLEYVRTGRYGSPITLEQALANTSVFRCMNLVCNSMGMLPMVLQDRKSKEAVETHPLHDLLMFSPNGWQTPFEFKQLMQFNLLADGNAYAVIVRSMGRVVALVPIRPDRVRVEQNADWTLSYWVTPNDRTAERPVKPEDMLHLRAISRDGIKGESALQQARNAIQLALDAEMAAGRVFKNGMIAGGALSFSGELSDEAFDRLRKSIDEKTGAENAYKWLILEQGAKAEPFSQTSADAQQVETRDKQVEEIARAFGVPRPFMNLDETSWGSGIEQLAIMFVTSALSPWFRVWEEGVARTCLSKGERRLYEIDVDERELLRGSMKDQAEFLAKASGSGGHRPWMTTNEIRKYTGYGPKPDGDELPVPANMQSGTQETSPNEPSQAA